MIICNALAVNSNLQAIHIDGNALRAEDSQLFLDCLRCPELEHIRECSISSYTDGAIIKSILELLRFRKAEAARIEAQEAARQKALAKAAAAVEAEMAAAEAMATENI